MNALDTDLISYKIFGRNVNPLPSKEWFTAVTDEEIAEWQGGDPGAEKLLDQRVRVAKSVDQFDDHEREELEGIRHWIPPLIEDLNDVRRVPIDQITLQPIRRQSGRFLVKCVFHDDSHPSCVIYPGRGFFCFSCGKGGNAVDWVKEEYGFTFQQAVEFLQKYI